MRYVEKQCMNCWNIILWRRPTVQILFQGEFNDVTPPNKSTVVRIINKFRIEYSVWDKVPKSEKTMLPQKVEEI